MGCDTQLAFQGDFLRRNVREIFFGVSLGNFVVNFLWKNCAVNIHEMTRGR